MKYWRGYLVAAIFIAITRGLAEFCLGHWELVDMVYPYISRLIQNYLANWSSGVDFCLWQVLLMVGGILVIASIVMMVIWKWNPIQWFGWILAAASVVFFLNTAMFGLNDYAGSISQDIHLEVFDYTVSELEQAGKFYRDKANTLAQQVNRDSQGNVSLPDFEVLAAQAGDGFESQTYDYYRSVFAGTTVPVKALSWPGLFTGQGITGVTVGITGEAAVNPDTPPMVMPFVINREMAKRMCITADQDAAFAAFLAGDANASPAYRYSAYFMAYCYCYDALSSMNTSPAQAAATILRGGENNQLKKDMDAYTASFAYHPQEMTVADEDAEGAPRPHTVDLLVSWHIQQYVLPTLQEEEVVFDPFDESQVDLSGLPGGIYD